MRDFRADKETSFRSFAELCVTRQIITAIKTATRFKHAPLNTYVSFSHTPAGQESDGDCTLGDALPGPAVDDPSVVRDLDRGAAEPRLLPRHGLSPLEADALRLYLEGSSYEEMAERARLRHEDDRQRAPAGQAQDPQHQQTRQVLASDAIHATDLVVRARSGCSSAGRCAAGRLERALSTGRERRRSEQVDACGFRTVDGEVVDLAVVVADLVLRGFGRWP